MHLEALEKVLKIARKNPKVLLSPSYFEKISARLNIDTKLAEEVMILMYNGRKATIAVITPQNCEKYKCRVQEGKNGIMIFEYVNALVALLTDEETPPSPHDKLGQTAEFYCNHGIKILQNKFLHNIQAAEGNVL